VEIQLSYPSISGQQGGKYTTHSDRKPEKSVDICNQIFGL